MIFNQKTKYFVLILLFFQTALAENRTVKEKEGIKLYNEGIQLIKESKYEESITYFDKAIAKIPKLMKAYYAKSRVFGQLKRPEDAIKACNDALELSKKQPRMLAQKAFALYALARYRESLETAQLAVQYGDNLSITHEARANAYATLGNYELALEDYDKAIKLIHDLNNSLYDETYLNRFCPLYKLGRYEEALATCNKALEITDNPNNLPQIYSKKAMALNKLGRYEEALENANKALEVNAKDPLALSEKNLAKSKLKKDSWF